MKDDPCVYVQEQGGENIVPLSRMIVAAVTTVNSNTPRRGKEGTVHIDPGHPVRNRAVSATSSSVLLKFNAINR